MVTCVFCEKARSEFRTSDEIMVFEPLNPVTPGHLLVVPVRHVADFLPSEYYGNTAVNAFKRAQDVAKELKNSDNGLDFNLITSAGLNATQSVFHLHFHIVPRQ